RLTPAARSFPTRRSSDLTSYGAKVQAMTVLDLVMRPELIKDAWDYFTNVQTKTTKYVPLMRPEDKPAIWLNEQTMAKYRPAMTRSEEHTSELQSRENLVC